MHVSVLGWKWLYKVGYGRTGLDRVTAHFRGKQYKHGFQHFVNFSHHSRFISDMLFSPLFVLAILWSTSYESEFVDKSVLDVALPLCIV